MVKLFLAGDVMIGRGVDQVMPQSVEATLYEDYIRDARDYVALAERANGPIPRGVSPEYVWGDALEAIDAAGPDYRLVNVETAITTSPTPWPDKGIHYRAHPANVGVLKAARLDCSVLANNHTLDWGEVGLRETLDSLHDAGLASAGAGRSLDEASAPVVLERAGGRRVIVVALASTSSGTPLEWLAAADRPGLWVFDRWSTGACEGIVDRLRGLRRPGDLLVVALHWGTNWGYEVPRAQRRLAHQLIDVAGADVVFGHSSHHPRPAELYRGRLVLYGCGDFITDYEGIGGHEEYRPDLVLAWFVEVDDGTGQTAAVEIEPFRLRRFRLEQASPSDVAWLERAFDRVSEAFAVGVNSDGVRLRVGSSTP